MIDYFFSVFLQFSSIAFILVLLACYRRSTTPIIAGVSLLGFFLLDITCLLLPRILGLAQFQWNWEGKILSSSWPLIVIYLFQWLTPAEVGLSWPKKNGWWLGLGLGIFFSVLNFVGLLFKPELISTIPSSKYNLESVLFQLSMPGITEELTFRGIYLAILNHFLGRPWQFLGARFGWGAFLVTALFISVHVIQYIPVTQQIAFNFAWITLLHLSLSFSFVYLREKSNSIWPCVVTHNLANGLGITLLWLML